MMVCMMVQCVIVTCFVFNYEKVNDVPSQYVRVFMNLFSAKE